MSTEIEIHTKNLELTERLQNYIDKKVPKLTRYIQGIISTRLDLKHEPTARNAQHRYVAQITVRGKRFILRAEERSDDIFTALNAALDNMQRRIRRYKERHYRDRGEEPRPVEPAAPEEETEQPTIVRRKRFPISPMDENEAIEQMEASAANSSSCTQKPLSFCSTNLRLRAKLPTWNT